MNKKLLKAMTLSLSCAMLASIGLVAACGEGGGGGDIDLDENGDITRYNFLKSVIRSRVKGVYKEVNLLLDGTLPATAEPDAHTPTRIICDYEFLLGRTLGADLNTYGGQLIAPKGSEVTAATVEKARYAGKLVELTLNSVKQ